VRTYNVAARRWELGWELHIDGIGVTQVATLASAGRAIRDYVAALTGADPGEIAVDYQIELDDELSTEIEAAREASREAERLQREAAARWRAVARQLSKDQHMTGSDVAAVLNVSPQRVSQLLNP
jgi:DNA-directed RNA polymerase specialized sigma subunit